VHEYFDDLAEAMIDSLGRSKISRHLLGEVLSRVAVNTPPTTTRDQIATGAMLRTPLPLSEGSVSKATGALRKLDFLEEDGPIRERTGRPLTPVRLGHRRWFCIGVHVSQTGGTPTELLVVATTLDDSSVLTVEQQPLQPGNLESGWPLATLTSSIVGAIKQVTGAPAVASRATAGKLPLLGVGVEINSPVHAGRIVDRRDGQWTEHDLRAELAAALGVPVVVENDANALAIRQTYGTNVAHQDFALVLVADEGIGAGVSVGGRVYRGSLGFAGELGHVKIDRAALPGARFTGPCWCGADDHVDAYATPSRIRHQLKSRGLDAGSATDVRDVYITAGSALGHGLVALINVFNPAEIVLVLPDWLGGPGPRSQDHTDAYVEAARAEVESTWANVRAEGILSPPTILNHRALAMNGARAAATRVLIEFIDHLSGIDGCLPKEQGVSAWTTTHAAAAIAGAAVGAVVGGALGATVRRAVPGAAIGHAIGRAAAEGLRSRSQPVVPTDHGSSGGLADDPTQKDSTRADKNGWRPPWETVPEPPSVADS
jgi:predicted NBD/HSP70 family sugar kinase